jgi:hypothetical protein
MRNFIMRKRVLVPASVVVVLLLAGVAYAYFSSTGSGTATATVGTSSVVTLHGTVASSLHPGASSSVSFTVDNPSAGSERVATIHLQSVAVDAGHSTCVTSDFTMPDVTVNQTFPNGNGQAVTATGTLTMANTGVSQDACQGATLTLNLTST